MAENKLSDRQRQLKADRNDKAWADREGHRQTGGEPDLMSNPAAFADEETEHSDEQEETYQPMRLHATTSRFDDWLHRGP